MSSGSVLNTSTSGHIEAKRWSSVIYVFRIPCTMRPTAIQQQLGLKLEPTKAPIEVLAIDCAEKPSGN